MTKKVLHVPRGSNKSYIDMLHESYVDSDRIRGIGDFIGISNDISIDFHQTENHLIFCNQNHVSNKTKRINITKCNFENIKDNFDVTYHCSYCRKKQHILNTDLLYSQFIKKPVNSFSDIKIYCEHCQKTNIVPLRLFIKKILCSYTAEPIGSFNNDLSVLLANLKKIFEFDCMLNNKTIYTAEADNLKDLIYD